MDIPIIIFAYHIPKTSLIPPHVPIFEHIKVESDGQSYSHEWFNMRFNTRFPLDSHHIPGFPSYSHHIPKTSSIIRKKQDDDSLISFKFPSFFPLYSHGFLQCWIPLILYCHGFPPFFPSSFPLWKQLDSPHIPHPTRRPIAWSAWWAWRSALPGCGACPGRRSDFSDFSGWEDGKMVISWWFSGWLVVWLPFFIFPEILGISNHPNWRDSYFSEGWPSNHQPVGNLHGLSMNYDEIGWTMGFHADLRHFLA